GEILSGMEYDIHDKVVQLMLVIDEGSRFRLDPAGVFRSTAVEEWRDKHGIFLDIVPGEAHWAHWKIGTCENAVQGVKNVMDKLSQHDENLSPHPAPDETGRFLAASERLPPDLLVEHPKGEFARSVQLRQMQASAFFVRRTAAWKRWSLKKGDVTGAFLQSREYPDKLYCVPTGSIMRVQRACYGLVDAPLEWWRSVVTRSSVETIVKANILLSNAKAKAGYKMKIHSFHERDKLNLVAWVDAGNCNRPDGGSTQGIFVGMATEEMLQGAVSPVSPIAWHSQKIDRTCRSPGAAEAQAAINGEDALYYARYQWRQFLHGETSLHQPDEAVKLVQGCVVTDSRTVHDKLETEVLSIKGAEKRTHIELLALKEALAIRWVHCETQLVNSLTKNGGSREYELLEDPTMMSARRRKERGGKEGHASHTDLVLLPR
ncbi:unnamed protein product, partial [Symbiodinium pilosum]